jgi:nicotinamidase-related amidase
MAPAYRTESEVAIDTHDFCLREHDALIIVDVQSDFLPNGRLAVPQGDDVVPALNRLGALFADRGLPVVATRDWHPAAHCSFRDQGGPWPPHCIADTPGAAFADALYLPTSTIIISKATQPDRDAYSGFERTELDRVLHDAGTQRLFVAGLATDYCVLNTVRDALALGYKVFVLTDAIRAVDVHAGDGARALAEMERLGAITITSSAIAG